MRFALLPFVIASILLPGLPWRAAIGLRLEGGTCCEAKENVDECCVAVTPCCASGEFEDAGVSMAAFCNCGNHGTDGRSLPDELGPQSTADAPSVGARNQLRTRVLAPSRRSSTARPNPETPPPRRLAGRI